MSSRAWEVTDGIRPESQPADPPTWASSNPALIAILEDSSPPDGLSVYAECLGPVDPAVASPIVEVSCVGEVDLGTGLRLVRTLPFEIQPEAAGATNAIIVVEMPEQNSGR